MDKRLLVPLVFILFLIQGCTQPQQQQNETILYNFQGLGVTSFGIPLVGTMSPLGSIQVVPPEQLAYISLILRNNAEGDKATDVIVSLNNIKPFDISECGRVHDDPYELRSAGDVCPPYRDDLGLPYASHMAREMYPGDEAEFFWTLKAPTTEEIANMFYDHLVYYTVEFHYKVTAYQSVMAMTYTELQRRIDEEKAIVGSMDISNGELKFVSETQEPKIYSTGSPDRQNFLLKYKISNTNANGIVKPGTQVNISITVPAEFLVVPDDITDYDWVIASEDATISNWLKREYTGMTDEIIGRTLFTNISAEYLRTTLDTVTLYVPLELEELISPSVLTLPFYLRVSYTYMLDCKTTTDCTLIRVEPLK